MDNNENQLKMLTSVGLSVFSESHRKIMSELISHGIPANYAVLTETAAEALIQAVAAMIVENNQKSID